VTTRLGGWLGPISSSSATGSGMPHPPSAENAASAATIERLRTRRVERTPRQALDAQNAARSERRRALDDNLVGDASREVARSVPSASKARRARGLDLAKQLDEHVDVLPR